MQFILVTECLEKFNNLRKDYEDERKVDLEATSSQSWLPTLFGGTDVKSRRMQISFLEKMKTTLDRFFHHDEQFNTPQEFQANLMASRIMIAACLSVQHQIGSSKENSALYRLINKYLGITDKNFLDDQDKEICYQTACQLIKTQDALTHINYELKSINQKEFSDLEWKLFSDFITDGEVKRATPIPPPNYFPVSTVVSPVFGETFYYVGLTIGWVIAGAVSSSSAAIAPRLELTSWVSSALLFIGPTNIAGVVLLAPTIAARLISAFCNFSFSNISGTAGRFIGEGTGKVVSLPFDLAYNLLRVSGSFIVNYTAEPPSLAPLNGICIANGTIVIHGHPLQLSVVPSQLESKPRLQITDTGEFIVDGESVNDPTLDGQMSLIIQELNEKLKSNTPTPEELGAINTFELEEFSIPSP